MLLCEQAILAGEPVQHLDEVLVGPHLVEQLAAQDEVAAIDPDVGAGHVEDAAHASAAVHGDDMEAVVRTHREEARGNIGRPGPSDHRRKVGVGQRVGVVGEERPLASQEMADGAQALTDRRVQSGVDRGDGPVVNADPRLIDAGTAVAGGGAVAHRLVVAEKETPDVLGLVAKAQHEVREPEVGVVLHHVPQNWPATDRDHRLADRLEAGIVGVAHPQSLPAAEDDDLHRPSTSGIGMTKRAP